MPLNVRKYNSAKDFINQLNEHGKWISCDGEEWITPVSIRDTCAVFLTIDGAITMSYDELKSYNYKFVDGTSVGTLCEFVNDKKLYYQPLIYHDDGINIGWDLPSELHSFEAFHTIEGCNEWLEENGYHLNDCSVQAYEDDDIEDITFLDD